MANKFYIREQASDQKTIRVVCHINAPASGNNSAVIQWRTALLSHLGGADNISSVVPEVTGTQEETDMKAGAVYEVSRTYRYSRMGLTTAEKNAEITTWYNIVKDEVWADLQVELQFLGHSS